MRSINICHLCGDDLNRCHHTYTPNKQVIMFNKDVTILELESKIKLQDQRIENLLRVVEFYGDTKSWKTSISSQACDENLRIINDSSMVSEPLWESWREAFVHKYFGGKLAREALARDKELVSGK